MNRAQMKANHRKIEQVACPKCGAQAGWPCVTPGRWTKSDGPHQARRSAAADAGVYVP